MSDKRLNWSGIEHQTFLRLAQVMETVVNIRPDNLAFVENLPLS